jgi:hypothetical protein
MKWWMHTAVETAQAHLLAIFTAIHGMIASLLVPYCCLLALYDNRFDKETMLRPILVPKSSVMSQMRPSWRATMQRLPMKLCVTAPSDRRRRILLIGTWASHQRSVCAAALGILTSLAQVR